MAIVLSALGCAAVDGGLVWDGTERVLGLAGDVGEVEVPFGFRVEGADVSIWKLETDCSCAKAIVTRERFAVGEEGEVRVKVKFPPAPGRHRKQVIVWTDDMSAVRQVLTVVGLIEGRARLSPGLVAWARGEPATGKWVVAGLEATRATAGATVRVEPDLFEVRPREAGGGPSLRWEVVPRDPSRPCRSVISVDLPRDGDVPPWTLIAVAEVR